MEWTRPRLKRWPRAWLMKRKKENVVPVEIILRLQALEERIKHGLADIHFRALKEFRWITRSNGQKNRVKKGGKK